MTNTDKDLRVWYHKYNAYEMAWTQIQALRSKGQWQFNLGKMELINLFGKRSMWNSHVRPAMRNINDYQAMIEWLERAEDDTEPSDLEVWGFNKQVYTFSDLEAWKKKKNGSLKQKEQREEQREEKGKGKEKEKEKEKEKKRGKRGKESGEGKKSSKSKKALRK